MRQKGTAEPTVPLIHLEVVWKFGKGQPEEAGRFPLLCGGDWSGF